MTRGAGGLRELCLFYASEIALVHHLYGRHLLYLGSNSLFQPGHERYRGLQHRMPLQYAGGLIQTNQSVDFTWPKSALLYSEGKDTVILLRSECFMPTMQKPVILTKQGV